MPLKRARSIDEIAELAAGSDVVLSSDAPLTLALDRRATSPRVGRVASTPRSHASGELVTKDRRELFCELIKTEEVSWKSAAWALDLTLESWDHTGERAAILNHEEFDTHAVRKAVELLGETSSSYRDLDETTIPDSADVAVVNQDALSELDRGILPREYRHIEAFRSGEAELPDVHLYRSATAIVNAVVEQVSASNAEQVGVVVDQETVYAPLLEAAFAAQDIPYQGGPGFIDAEPVRQFLRLVQTCFSGSELTVAEVKPLLIAAGWEIPRDVEKQRVAISEACQRSEGLQEFETLAQRIREGTFGAAVNRVEAFIGRDLTILREELEKLGILHSKLTESRINALIYYLQSFEVPVEQSSDGVLLSDATATAYIDRPVVFYLGLGEGWAATPPDMPWIDERRYTENDRRRFQILLQNGVQQYILSQTARAGKPLTPCPYLRDLLSIGSFETLADIPDSTRHEHSGDRGEATRFGKPVIRSISEPEQTVSQSGLKDLVISPRDYYFGKLLDSPTNFYMERGNVLHEAAELYVNDNRWFTGERRRRLLDEMCTRVAPYVHSARRDSLRTRFDVGLTVIEAYLSENTPAEVPHPAYGEAMRDNGLAESLGVTLSSELCERWFSTLEIGVHGVVDLLQNEQTLVDYKSGRVSSQAGLLKDADIEDLSSTPDFQVLFYLAQHRHQRPETELEMRFVYPLGDLDAMVKGKDPDLEELVTSVTYLPCSFAEWVRKRSTFEKLTAYAKGNPRRKVLDPLGFEWYRDFFTANPLPRPGSDLDRRAAVKQNFLDHAETEIGLYKYVSQGVDSIFADLEEPSGSVLRDDIDAFEDFVADRIEELNAYKRTRFPFTFQDAEPNWDRVNHRACILREDD